MPTAWRSCSLVASNIDSFEWPNWPSQGHVRRARPTAPRVFHAHQLATSAARLFRRPANLTYAAATELRVKIMSMQHADMSPGGEIYLRPDLDMCVANYDTLEPITAEFQKELRNRLRSQ
jgi:hypothetical protein